MTKTWINHHNHTTTSFLDGHSRPRTYIERALELGMSSVAVTDHGNVHGWPDFYDAAKDLGANPILGMEAYESRKTRIDRDEEERSGPAINEWDQRGPHHLTLIAKNYEGYKNIIKISSRAFLEGFYVKPRMDVELLANHSEGVIVLSGCLSGKIQQAILRQDYEHAEKTARQYQEIVGRDNFFIEVMNHHIDEEQRVLVPLVELAKKIDAKIIPTGDCHYVHKSDTASHDLMLAVSTNATIYDEGRFKFKPEEFYLKSYEEMAESFPDEWLRATVDLANQVELSLPIGDQLYFPDYPLPPERELNEYLDELVWEGLVRRYGAPIPGNVKERAEYELGVVRRMGFQPYYLVVWDLIRWAKDQKIRVGWGRGSAAGSILSYALGITKVDPIKFGLLFERFLIEGRKQMPDFDLDFDDRYRDKVIDYVKGKYGVDHVSNICTFNSVGAKLAIRDAARALGYPYQNGNLLSKMVPPPVLGTAKTLAESMATPEMRKAYEDKDNKIILDAAKGLEGLLRQPGIHPAGVVISQRPVMDHVPVMQKGKEKPIVSQWDLHRIEDEGLLKIDFLGLRTMGVIEEAINRIAELTGEEIDLDELSTDDPYTYEQLALGHTQGVFQLDSSGIQKMTVALRPNCIEDLMAILSLYRPGPMGSGMDKMFIARKNGRQQITHTIPQLGEVLDKTRGIMLYQEDMLEVASKIAGFSPSEADDLRKACGKKILSAMQAIRQSFVAGCFNNLDVNAEKSNKLFSDIEYFAGYAFNKSHAAGYAMISYTTAYLKFHYPAPFMAALLSSVTEHTDKTAAYITEARRLGLTIHPPDVNKSKTDYTVLDEKQISLGLNSVHGIGPAVLSAILDYRSEEGYTSLNDFFRQSNTAVLTRGMLEHLVRSGALDELAPEQTGKFSHKQKRELLELEKEEIGVYVSDHPLLDVWHTLEPNITHTISELELVPVGSNVRLAGLLTRAAEIVTRKGQKMGRFYLEDMHTAIEVTLFPKTYEKVQEELIEGNICYVKGKLETEGDDNQIVKIIGFDVERVEIPRVGAGKPIVVKFDGDLNPRMIQHIEKIIEDLPGDAPFKLVVEEGEWAIEITHKKPTSLEAEPMVQKLIGLSK